MFRNLAAELRGPGFEHREYEEPPFGKWNLDVPDFPVRPVQPYEGPRLPVDDVLVAVGLEHSEDSSLASIIHDESRSNSYQKRSNGAHGPVAEHVRSQCSEDSEDRQSEKQQ